MFQQKLLQLVISQYVKSGKQRKYGFHSGFMQWKFKNKHLKQKKMLEKNKGSLQLRLWWFAILLRPIVADSD